MISKRVKRSYVSQLDETDCGIAALLGVIKYFGSSYTFSKLRNLAKTNTNGTTILGLNEAAKKLNFNTRVIKSNAHLLQVKELPVPFIAHVIKNDEVEHYYTIYHIYDSQLLVGDPDPSVGLKLMDIQNFLKEWTGVVLFVSPSLTYKPTREHGTSLFNLFLQVMKRKSLIFGIFFSSLVITIISIASSYFLQLLIDHYIPQKEIFILSIIASGLIMAYFVQAIFSFVQSFLIIRMGQYLMNDVILGFVNHVFKLPMDFFQTRKVGEVVSRFSDASRIIDALASTIISVFLDFTTVLLMAMVLSVQNFMLFLISLASLPLFVLATFGFAKRFERLNQATMESSTQVNSTIIERLQGIETLKALGMESQSLKKIHEQFSTYLSNFLKYNLLESMQQSLKNLIQLIFSIITLWLGAVLIIHGKLSVGELLAFNSLLGFFTSPFQSIINLQTQWQAASVANNRLNEMTEIPQEPNTGLIDSSAGINFGRIVFKDVSFRYGYGEKALKNVDFQIIPQQMTSIVGLSGSGKSTVLKLMVNFFQVSEGKIFIDNIPIENINRHILREHIQYVSQEAHVFSGTLRENLLFGKKEKVPDEEIWNACRKACLDLDIQKFPLQLDTKLDENGSGLSGGQKQRLTIARALLSPAEVLLFDETTSSLDTITEKNIVMNLSNETKKTIIFVAHRLEITKMTPKILVFSDGQLIESGGRDKLLSSNGLFKRLFNV